MEKKANPRKGAVRTFVERVNSDPLVRLRFLVDPARALDEAGIHLNEEAKSELDKLVHEYLEKFPNIALLPTGLSKRSRAGEATRGGVDEGACEGMFII
jgi:hypothetical protein